MKCAPIANYLKLDGIPERVRRVYNRLLNSSTLIFDEAKYYRVAHFIENFLLHTSGAEAGKPFKLLPFQAAFLAALYGITSADGKRIFREAFVLMGRKNGKSELLAALCLYAMCEEYGAQVYSIASKRDQAAIVFNIAKSMIKLNSELTIEKRKSDLYLEKTNAVFMPLGRNADSLDGLNASFVCFDECHCVKDYNIYDVMRRSMSAREQPLLITITTAGTMRESVFDALYSYALGVCEGTITDLQFLPLLYELDKEKDYTNPEEWKKANPALDVIKKRDALALSVERAKSSPNELNYLLAKDFNIISNSPNSWLTWEALNNEETFELEKFRNWYCVAGVDLSRSGDLSCSVVLFMDENERKFCYSMFWLPEETLKRRRNSKIPFDIWARQGILRICEENKIKPVEITEFFSSLYSEFEIVPLEIRYDPWSAVYWVEEMKQAGFNMVECRQGAKTLSVPLGLLTLDLTAKQVNYNNNPLMKWCLANATTTQDRNGNRLLAKTCDLNKIDGAAALLDAYVALNARYTELLNWRKEPD